MTRNKRVRKYSLALSYEFQEQQASPELCLLYSIPLKEFLNLPSEINVNTSKERLDILKIIKLFPAQWGVFHEIKYCVL